MTTLIQADYERLNEISARFGQQAEATQRTNEQIRQSADTLLNGNWEGRGSNAFHAEMIDEVYPALARFSASLDEARRVTQQLVVIVQTAEEEAALPFATDQAEPSTTVEAKSYTHGNNRSPRQSANPLSNTAAWERPSSEQIDELFSPDEMDELIGYQHPVTYPEAMGEAMSSLFRIPPLAPQAAETQALLQEMANAYGENVSASYLEEQYGRYVTLFNEAYPNGEGPQTPFNLEPAITAPLPGLPAMPTLESKNFWGTTWQMRYGKVVGDALNIDPVFGAMLNPTGGLVGLGEYAITVGEDEGLGYHGTFHDAAGYLYNYHQTGPGYDYLNMEGHRDTGHPLTGQQSGIPYWNDRLPGTSITEFASDLSAPAIGAISDYGMFMPIGVQVQALWDGLTNALDF